MRRSVTTAKQKVTPSSCGAMSVAVRHPQTTDGVAFEVKLDQHRRLIPNDPAVMPRLDRHDLRRRALQGAAIRILDVDLASSEKAHVSVHTEIGADERLHVRGPSEAGRIHHAFDTSIPSFDALEPNASHVAAFRTLHWRQQ